MTEVQVIDLFSGCGGMSCGFMLAETKNVRFKLLGGLDVDPHANRTYARMLDRPALELSALDLIRKNSAAMVEALDTWGYQAELPLVLIGCAPCQGFSSHRKKDPRKDERNDLITCFAKIAAKLQPDIVLMENVPELLHSKHGSISVNSKESSKQRATKCVHKYITPQNTVCRKSVFELWSWRPKLRT